MLEYKLIDAKDKDIDILTSIKLVTMIDDEMDKALSYVEKNKIKKNIQKNIEITCDKYKIIYVGNKIAGAYVAMPYEEGYMIDEIYLFEEFRNNGIGTDIITKLKDEYNSLYVWVYKNNKDAVRFFKRMGFLIINNGRTLIMKSDNVYESIKSKLDEIKLGYRDKNGLYHVNFKDNFKEMFYLQSPRQLAESKVGSCFDQVEYEREIVSKLGVDSRTYFILYPDNEYDMSHTFLIYKDSKKYYWVENAWLKYKGLHMYDNKKDLLDDVLKKFVSTIPDGEMSKVKLYMYEKPRMGISYSKFLSNCINGRSIKIK